MDYAVLGDITQAITSLVGVLGRLVGGSFFAVDAVQNGDTWYSILADLLGNIFDFDIY